MAADSSGQDQNGRASAAPARGGSRDLGAILCAIVKDERRYLEEWAAFHLAIGFEHIVLYDNDSTDSPAALFRERGWPLYVTVVPWPTIPPHEPQRPAYQDCVARYRERASWIAFLDADEFLNLKRHSSLGAFLGEHADASAVGINWRLFGSGARAGYEPGFVIDRFTRAAAADYFKHQHVKTICRPEAVETADIHSPGFRDGTTFVSPDGTRRIPLRNAEQPYVDLGIAQINHYFTKSRAEFETKRARGRADLPPGDPDRHRPQTDFAIHDRNEEEDVSILRWRPALVRKLAEINDVR